MTPCSRAGPEGGGGASAGPRALGTGAVLSSAVIQVLQVFWANSAFRFCVYFQCLISIRFEVEYGYIRSSLLNFFRTKKPKLGRAVTVASSSNSTITRAEHVPGSWETAREHFSVHIK